TEPGEALLLGGYTAVLDQGRLLQYGPATDVFHFPRSLQVARAFSDPPMNFFSASRAAGGVQLLGKRLLPVVLPDDAAHTQQAVTVGLRARSLRVQGHDGDQTLHGNVLLAEISGSDTYIHLASDIGDVVAQLPGVHHVDIGAALTLHFSPSSIYVFDHDGALVLAPPKLGGR